MTIIDAHIHTWCLDDGFRIWIRQKIAALQRDFRIEDYAASVEDLGVDAAIVVQSATSSDETDRLIRQYRNDDTVAGVIGWLDLASPDVGDKAAECIENDKFCGIRAHPPHEFDVGWLLSQNVQEGLRVMEEQKIPVDFLVNCTQLSAFTRAIASFPDLPAILDHAGRPFVMTGDTDKWEADIGEIAQHTGCLCKLSGLVERAGVEWDMETLKPWIGILLETFGPDRLIFASNWPVMTLMASPRLWLETVNRLFDDFGVSSTDRQKIFCASALSAYNLRRG